MGCWDDCLIGQVSDVPSRILIECPLLHGNIQKETDTETEKSNYYDFMRFGDSGFLTQ